MSRLTRDGTAKSVSRNQILRREREQGNFSLFSCPWTGLAMSMDRIGKLTRLICTQLFVMTTHAYIYTVGCTLNSRLLSGHLGFVTGTLRGSLFPLCYGSLGVQLTWPRALCQGTLTLQWAVQKNLNTTVLQVTGTLQQSSRVFFYSRV